MQKKWLIPGIIALVIVIVVFIILLKPIPEEEPGVYYSDDPRTWIDDKPGGIKEVNVDKVTKGDAYIDPNGQQYDTDEIGTVFSYEGWYKGEYFKRDYVENNRIIMRINQGMKPRDGIIEGFIVEKIEDDVPIIYIFLDEDWKNLVSNTKIYWGKTYQNITDFNFSNKISNGIYMNQVTDDIDRFENNYSLHSGGVYVGDLRQTEDGTIIAFY